MVEAHELSCDGVADDDQSPNARRLSDCVHFDRPSALVATSGQTRAAFGRLDDLATLSKQSAAPGYPGRVGCNSRRDSLRRSKSSVAHHNWLASTSFFAPTSNS